LPFTLPVAKNFQFAYAEQANLTIEREIAGTWKISVGYQYTHGVHLERPVDINSTKTRNCSPTISNSRRRRFGFHPILLSSSLPTATLLLTRNKNNTCACRSSPRKRSAVLSAAVAALNGQYVALQHFLISSGLGSILLSQPPLAAAMQPLVTQPKCARESSGYP